MQPAGPKSTPHLRRCWGRTGKLYLRRCGRLGEWRFFCNDHRLQLLIVLVPVLAGVAVVANVASIQSAWFRKINTPIVEVILSWSPFQFMAVNETDDPIDSVSITVMRSHAGPEYDQNSALINMDLVNTLTIPQQGSFTLRPQLATSVSSVPAYLVPNADRPTLYQIRIYTRHQTLTEFLYVTPKNGAFDEAVDLADDKTHKWFKRQGEAAMKRWKNWPEWWR